MRKNANIWITGQTHVFSSRGNATLYASVGAFTHCLEKAELLEQFWRGPHFTSTDLGGCVCVNVSVT